jgi:predicted amidohydrolase
VNGATPGPGAIRVAVVQVGIPDEERRDQRIDRVTGLVGGLRGVDLVVLPELWAVGFARFDDYAAAAEMAGGSLEQRLAGAARRCGAELFAGSVLERDDDALYNTSLHFAADGTLRGRYRKIHLWGGGGSRERDLLRRGQDVTVFDSPLGRLGLATCYDLRFPELFRAMVDRGAEMFLIASAWPYPRVEAWTTLLRARAIENLAFVVAANCAGASAYCGRSGIVDPWGTMIAAAGDTAGVLWAEIDPTAVADARRRFPSLRDRVLGGDGCG